MAQTVVAISGVKNSGKTTLITRLLPHLEWLGLSVAVIKHDGHAFLPDPLDTDTGKYMAAGAMGAAIFDGVTCKVIRRSADTDQALLACFPDADLILLEGFKYSPWPKLEVVRWDNSRETVCDPATVLAVVTDGQPVTDRPLLPLNDPEAVAAFLADYCKA